MWFLIKGSIFFSLVLVALSYFGGSSDSNAPTSQMNVAGAVSAASEAYRYVSAICVEKPEVCEKGAETFSALGTRARQGAQVAFELLDKQFGDKGKETAVLADPEPTPFPVRQAETAAATGADTIFTGTVPVPQKRPTH